MTLKYHLYIFEYCVTIHQSSNSVFLQHSTEHCATARPCCVHQDPSQYDLGVLGGVGRGYTGTHSGRRGYCILRTRDRDDPIDRWNADHSRRRLAAYHRPCACKEVLAQRLRPCMLIWPQCICTLPVGRCLAGSGRRVLWKCSSTYTEVAGNLLCAAQSGHAAVVQFLLES